MTQQEKAIQTTAIELGYDPVAVRRDSLEEALEFVEKIANRCPQNVKHDVLYATQVVK